MSAPLLGPDPAVPQRDALIDPGVVAVRLASFLGGKHRIESCGRLGVTYAVGRRVRVLHRVRIEGCNYLVAAGSFRSRSRSERAYTKGIEGARSSSGALPPVSLDAELATVFWTFPNDRRLQGLSAVAEPSRALTRLLDRPWTSSRFVDYQPESSAVACCTDDSDRVVAYAKVHSDDDGERTFLAHRALAEAADGTSLRLARPLAYSSRHRTLLAEPIAGPSIAQLKGRDLMRGLHAYGAALATLHSLPVADIPAPTDSGLDRLRRGVEAVRVVRPDVVKLAGSLVGELADRWDEAAGPSVLVHGDTNANNAILQSDSVALIDFDRASVGSAAADIGNFLSLLAYERALGAITRSAEKSRSAAFIDGYSLARDLPRPSSMRVHFAAALVERALRAVKRISAPALTELPALLAEARAAEVSP